MSNGTAYERLFAACLESIRGELEWYPADAVGDSPIEQLFSVAVMAQSQFGMNEHRAWFSQSQEDTENFKAESSNRRSHIIVEAQKKVAGWRVDFLIHAFHWGSPYTEPLGWQTLIVECDGHSFHERDKKQAARDRSRDRGAQQEGFTVFRFTGSELWHDSWGCARQVFDWAARGVY